MNEEIYKINEFGTLVHIVSGKIFDYIHYNNEYFICVIPYQKDLDTVVFESEIGAKFGIEVNFSQPLDFDSVKNGNNYIVHVGIRAEDFVKNLNK